MSKIILILPMLIVLALSMAACGRMPPGAATAAPTQGFTLSSPEVIEGGALPAEYTCDGVSATLPLTWLGAPPETKSFAVIMEKAYTYTIYALSAQPQFAVPASQVNREVLLAAMRNITLARAELHVTYARR